MILKQLRVREIFAAIIVSMLFAAFVTTPILRHFQLSEAVASNFGSIIAYVIMFLLARYVASKAGMSSVSVFGKKPSVTFLPLAILYALLLLCFSYGENFIETYSVARHNPEFAYKYWNYHEAPYILHVSVAGYVAIVIAQFVLAPLVEEFVFRGLLLRACGDRWGVTTAVLTSSVLFAAMHYSRHYFLSTFVFGVVMCLLCLKYRSLWINALTHGLSNLAAFLVQFIFNFHWLKTPEDLEKLSSWMPEIVMIIVSIPVLVLFLVRNWPSQWPMELTESYEGPEAA
jgi:membrane protease YdiL (CAAX protease family)